mgnify:FL=1
MANHVNGYLSVHQISEEGQKVWDEYVVGTLEKSRGIGGSAYDTHLGYFIFESDDEGEFTNWDFSTMCDEVGAKWAYAEDFDECGISMTSAWSPCLPFCEMIAQKIAEVDPSVQLVLTYEDEFPNFVGVATFSKGGMDNDDCIEWDDLRSIMIEENEDLAVLWNEDEEEWTDDDAAFDILCDVKWDVIAEWQQSNICWSVS